MKIVVCIKQIATLGDGVEFDESGTDVDRDYLEYALNEWDSFSTEEAVQIKERADGAAEIVAITVGGKDAEPALRRCLAMGADRAIRVEGPVAGDPLSIACALASAIRAEAPDLILCGVQSSDSVQAATGSALAGHLDLPVAGVVTKLDFDAAGRKATVERELEGGLLNVVEVATPAVVTIQSGINAPRYATFRAIKQAEKQEIAVVPVDSPASPANVVRRMFVPLKGDRAEMLGSNAGEVADRIIQMVKEATK